MNSRELYEAFNEIDDRYLDLIDALETETIPMKPNPKHNYTRKFTTVLIAAALCISILAVTAIAAGWVPGIFLAISQSNPEEKQLFEAASNANSEAYPETKEIPQLEYSNFTLFERYYDGETILLGYNMDLVLPEPFVGYEPDEAALEKIKSGTDFGNASEEALQYTDNASTQGLTGSAANMDMMFRDMLSEEAYEEVWKHLREKGYVCVVTHDVYIGDHIFVNGADIGEVLSPEVGNMRWEYEVEEGSCIKLNPLPEAGRNQKQVTVTLKIRSYERYWYLDLENNARYSAGNHQEELMEFVLENVNQK